MRRITKVHFVGVNMNHLVRSLPAKYPPMTDAKIWVTISHAMAAFPIVEPDTPIFDPGEIEGKPRPVPNASRMSDSAAATKAPAITAGHDMPYPLCMLHSYRRD